MGDRRRLKGLLPTLLSVYIPLAALVVVLAIISLRTDIPFSRFSRDPLAVARIPSYIGLLSNVGVLLWCASAAVCLFSFVVLRRDEIARDRSLFFLYAGLLTLVILADDLFMLHEAFTEYLADEISVRHYVGEVIVYSLYVIAAATLAVKSRAVLLKMDLVLLVAAGGFLGLSLVFDDFVRLPGGYAYLAEDSTKLFGIASWFAYIGRTALFHVAGRESPPEPPEP